MILKRKFFYFIIPFFLLSLMSCDSLLDPDKGTKSSYVFEFNCSSGTTIDVNIKNGGSPSSFTLSSSNRSVTVTWEDEGEDYYGGFICTYHYTGVCPHYTRYDALKKVGFYQY